MDSTNLQPPDFSPRQPDYPQVLQIIRLAIPSPLEGSQNVYPSFVQQMGSPLALRDREPCCLMEVNGGTLQPLYYQARLVGSYLGLPLFATACCVIGSATAVIASSSQSPRSSSSSSQ